MSEDFMSWSASDFHKLAEAKQEDKCIIANEKATVITNALIRCVHDAAEAGELRYQVKAEDAQAFIDVIRLVMSKLYQRGFLILPARSSWSDMQGTITQDYVSFIIEREGFIITWDPKDTTGSKPVIKRGRRKLKFFF